MDAPILPRRKLPRLKWLGFALVILLAGVAGWWFSAGKVWTDGQAGPEAIHVAADVQSPRQVLWTPPRGIDGAFNTTDQEYEPCVSSDGAELYFVRGKAGQPATRPSDSTAAATRADIYVSYRRDNAWTVPVPLDAVNSPYDDLGPRLTADGRFLLFYSNRPGGQGGYDLWASARSAGGWGTPFNLGPGVNSEFDEYSPAPSPDGRRLFFSTNRTAARREQGEAWRATIRETPTGDFDLWIADMSAASAVVAGPRTVVDGNPLSPVAATKPSTLPSPIPSTSLTLALVNAREVPGVNTPWHEGSSCISPAGDFLYFASNRPGGFGKFDIYRSRITGENFGAPENLGPSVNTADNETDPELGLGGFRLYFSSDRRPTWPPPSPFPLVTRADDLSAATQPTTRISDVAAAGATPAVSPHGGYDLYQSDSREVFAERQSRDLPQISRSVWAIIASIALLLPLLFFMSRLDRRKLSLLQKCLLVAMLVHIGLFFSFTVISTVVPGIPLGKNLLSTLGLSEVTLNLDSSPGSAASDIAMDVRQQSTNDLPVSAAPVGVIARQVAGQEIVAKPDVAVNVPQSSAGHEPLTVQVQAPKMVAPLPAPSAAAAVPAAAMALQTPPPDIRINSNDRMQQADPSAQAPKVQLPSASIAAAAPALQAIRPSSVDVPRAEPSDAKQSVGSLAQAVGAVRPNLPSIALPKVDLPSPPKMSADAAPSITSAAPAAARMSDAGPKEPTSASPAAMAERASTAVGLSPAPQAVQAQLPTPTASTGGAADSLAKAPGVAPRISPDAAASVAGIAPSAAATELMKQPEIGAVPPQSVPVRGGEPEASVAAKTLVPGLSRQDLPTDQLAGGAAKAAGSVDVKPEAARATDGSMASLSSPTTRPSATALAAATDVTGPTVGHPPGAAAFIAGPIDIKPASSARGQIADRSPTDAPAVAGAAPSATKAQAPSAAAAANNGPGSATAMAVKPTADASAGGSLASNAAVGGPRAITPAPAMPSPIASGAGIGQVVGGPDGLKIDLPKMANGPLASGGQDHSEGPAATPSAGVGAGPVASRSTGGGLAIGDRPVELASAGIPGVGPLRPASLGVGVPNAPIRSPADFAPGISVSPNIFVAPPNIGAPDPLSQRSPEMRRPLIEKLGGTKESENAVDRGLAFLAKAQEREGRWGLVTNRLRGSNPGEHDMALTGLATLAFLAADHSPNKEGPYRLTVARGLDWLVSQQGADGDLRGPADVRGGGSGRANMYDHGIATMALAEGALMSGDPRYTQAAFKAASFICANQNAKTGGWRYVPGEAGDTSVFGWQMLALHDCEQLGFQIPAEVRDRSIRFLSLVSSGPNGMLAAYRPNEGPTVSMTAEALFCRILLGQPIEANAGKEVSEFLTRDLAAAGKGDLYFWYYASLSLSQMQVNPQVREAWDRWNSRCRDTLVATQTREGALAGSWSDVRWGERAGAGKVFSTALATLTLEVYYRYLPMQPGDVKGNQAAWKAAEPQAPAPAKSRRRVEPN